MNNRTPLILLAALAIADGCADSEGASTGPADATADVAADAQADAGTPDAGPSDSSDSLSSDSLDAAGGDATDGAGIDAAPPADALVEPDGDAGDGSGDADTVAPPPACTPAGEGEPPAPVLMQLGGFEVSADASTGAWQVTPLGGSAPVVQGPGACVGAEALPGVQVGVGEASVFAGFGAYQIDITTGVSWLPPESAAATVSKEGGLRLTWPLAGQPGESVSLRFEATPAGDLRVSLEATGPSDGGAIAMTCGADTGFFGLGTQVTGMDLRGRTFPLWTQEQGIGKPPGGGVFPLNNIPEAAYAPMGVWHTTDGLSAVLGTDAYSEIDLCATHEGRVELRSWTELPSFVIVRGQTPKERLTNVTAIVGRPPAPPDWVLAPWNDAVGGPEHLHAIASLLRASDVPSSAIWSEDWIGGEQTENGYRLSYAWAWDPAQYPDLPSDIEELHARGFAFLAYFNPFVPEPTAMWAEGEAGGWLIKNADGGTYTFLDPAFRDASLVDLTNPGAVSWLSGYLTTAAGDLGIDGWMADFAEWMPTDAVLHSGETGWAVHNRYPLDWQRVNREVMEAVHANEAAPNNWTFFVRSGWASTNGGTAGIAPTVWGGDQNTDWKYDDGFPTVLPIAAHVGLCGVGIFGSDIAGYTSIVNENTNKELFLRWASFGALHPLMRTHHGSDECGNWSFDRDPETLGHYRRWASVHVLLLPTWRALVAESVAAGIPVTRHAWLVEPGSPGLWAGDQYEVFVGDDLLVAPVLTEGATTRVVRIPGDGWWPLFGDAPLSSGVAGPGATVEVTVEAPATDLPLFVRPGRGIALLGDVVDSFYGATEPGVTDLADVEGRYRVALYPDASGAVAPVTVGEAVVSAVGLELPVVWATATIGGVPLPECEAAPEASCKDGATVVVRGGDVTVVSGDATVTVAGPVQELRVGVGGAAWGEWAAPTPLTDLDPNIPPPCLAEP